MDPTTLAEGVSLFLITATLVLMALLSRRAKTLKSFQFQMFLVIAILFASEAPHILSDMGVIQISGVEDIGLVVHTISMVILVAFISIRAASYFRQGRSPEK